MNGEVGTRGLGTFAPPRGVYVTAALNLGGELSQRRAETNNQLGPPTPANIPPGVGERPFPSPLFFQINRQQRQIRRRDPADPGSLAKGCRPDSREFLSRLGPQSGDGVVVELRRQAFFLAAAQLLDG